MAPLLLWQGSFVFSGYHWARQYSFPLTAVSIYFLTFRVMATSKEIQLKKHKQFATGLFFIMAAIYGIMVYLQHHDPQSWMGYVEAFSEAGMVGALADWFAVTALFRHPLGIPIPHTNLIERKKDDLRETFQN